MKKEKLERIMNFTPAFDKRSDIPSKNYGIGGVQCFMGVKGKKGAAVFVFSTGILLESTVTDYIKDGRAKYEMLSENNPFWLNKPMGYDVGYHTYKPQHEGQELRHPQKIIFPKGKKPSEIKSMEEMSDYTKKIKFIKKGPKPPACEFLGKPCYCDGSAMRAEEWMNILIEKGSDPIWKMLEEEYESLI